MNAPLVSVVLPVFDGGRFLRDAVASILAQTLDAFELIVVDDGSSDGSQDVVRSFADTRIRLVEQGRQGLVAALNRGLAESQAEFVARMDADDVSLPHRLERQLEVLRSRPRVGLVGASYLVVDESGAELRRVLLPQRDHDLRVRLLLRNPFTHGSVMLRRTAIGTGGYDDRYGNNEDYDLWRRIARTHELTAVRELSYVYRSHALGISQTTAPVRVEDRERLRDEIWGELAPAYRLRSALRGNADGADDQWAIAREAMHRRRPFLAARALAAGAVLEPNLLSKVASVAKRQDTSPR